MENGAKKSVVCEGWRVTEPCEDWRSHYLSLITQLLSSEPAEEMLHYPNNSSRNNSNGSSHSLSDYCMLGTILHVSYLLFSQQHSFQLYDMFATELQKKDLSWSKH